MGKSINEIPPREQVGADTAKRFDYQYDRAAEECLSLLEDDGAISVLCEWHDDYVSEYENNACGANLYCFYQVKTKEMHLAPWDFKDLFGLPSNSARAKEKDNQEEKDKEDKKRCETSIVGRMFNHYKNFTNRCKFVVLVTNAGVDRDITKLLEGVQLSQDETSLTNEYNDLFQKAFSNYSLTFGVSGRDFFSFLKILVIQSESARLGKSFDDMSTLMMQKILNLSEIELGVKDAKAICTELVELVRDKSKEIIKKEELPLTNEELRRRKGIIAKDVLKLLSLSASAYEQLRESGDSNIVRSISRFHRLCKKTGMSEELIPGFCKIKTKWDLWRREYRTHLDSQDELNFLTFTNSCEELIMLHSAGSLSFQKMGEEAGKIAKDYKSLLLGQSELTAEIVMGYIFALIAERE